MRRALTVGLMVLCGFAGSALYQAWATAFPHYPGSHYFSDCKTTSPSDQDIGWAKEWGIVKGYSDGTYRPQSAVTREQMATYIMRSQATSPIMAVMLVDLTLCGGQIYGDAALKAGLITQDEYQGFQDLADTYLVFCDAEMATMQVASTAAGATRSPEFDPAAMRSAGAVLRQRLGEPAQ